MSPKPVRTIRVDDDTWRRWQALGVKRGRTVTDLIHTAMDAELDDPRQAAPAVALTDIGTCTHPRSKLEAKGYGTFCSKDKGGCGAKVR